MSKKTRSRKVTRKVKRTSNLSVKGLVGQKVNVQTPIPRTSFTGTLKQVTTDWLIVDNTIINKEHVLTITKN